LGGNAEQVLDYIAGVPVLINYLGWLAELVQVYECGYAVRLADSKAFEDALIHASGRRAALALVGKRA
jgi:hypothetical protein